MLASETVMPDRLGWRDDRRLLAALSKDRRDVERMAEDSRRALADSYRVLRGEDDPFRI